MASGPICELANISTSGKLGHYSFNILNKDNQVNLKSTNRAPASAGLFTNFILKSASRKNTKNFKLGLGTFFDGPIKINLDRYTLDFFTEPSYYTKFMVEKIWDPKIQYLMNNRTAKSIVIIF